MTSCGSQCILCDLPIRFDTYRGCSHGCVYCFAQKKHELNQIVPNESVESLRNFINGKRNQECNWCDWNIPIHIGGMSDPFQPCEAKYGRTKECLKLLAETQYPFVISTKGKLIVRDDYLNLVSKCNCVVQISMACNKYDKIEPGCPSFEERLEMVRTLSSRVKRVIIRVQPYLIECHEDIFNNLEKFKEAGAYGVIVEGMKFFRKHKGTVRVCGDFCYDYELIKKYFLELKKEAHRVGLKIYAGENRLREYGDSLTCCGIDGLEGFEPNEFNLNHICHGDYIEPTEAQRAPETGLCFKAAKGQSTLTSNKFGKQSFA